MSTLIIANDPPMAPNGYITRCASPTRWPRQTRTRR